MTIRHSTTILFLCCLALAAGCTSEFDPGIVNSERLVVEGMVTNQNCVNRIRLSKSTQVGMPLGNKPVSGAVVSITDENGIIITLTESPPGTYVTDSTQFIGRTGGKYSLNAIVNGQAYETDFIEMLPVPEIASLYYEKVVITASRDSDYIDEGARVYIDTYDPSGKCRYFRWDYTETWEYKIPYNVVNKICWVSEKSDEIVIIDRNTDLAEGQVSDLVHGQPFFPTVTIRTGSAADYTEAALIVITAGSAQKPGETRLDLLRKNAAIVGGIAAEVAASGSSGVMLIVTNPVDVLTWVAIKRSGWPADRVIGSGTVLDSARFRHFIALHCNVDVHNVHAYILGEHGDSEVAAWSMTHIGGIPIDSYCPLCSGCNGWRDERKKIEQLVRESAYHIINAKGSTHFAVGLALVKITSSILRRQNSVLAVSTFLNGEYGIKDVCLSLPAVVSDTGVIRIVDGPLSSEEKELLRHSADVLKKAIKSTGML